MFCNHADTLCPNTDIKSIVCNLLSYLKSMPHIITFVH